jgi:hypothetical protein
MSDTNQVNATGEAKPKTEAQLKREAEKEAKKAQKLAKLEEKQKKRNEQEEAKKDKEPKKKVKAKDIIEYTANTKAGDKKGRLILVIHKKIVC